MRFMEPALIASSALMKIANILLKDYPNKRSLKISLKQKARQETSHILAFASLTDFLLVLKWLFLKTDF
jgi:hypothetical protein